jgi:hypothetical protein
MAMGKTTKQPVTTLDWAKEYIKRAWPVLPCYSVKPDGDCMCPPHHKSRRQEDGTCRSPGKHPASHLAPNGSGNATIDFNQIKQWFSEEGEYNIAVATGKNNQGLLVVVDLDVRKGKDGPGVHAALIAAANKPLPITLSQTTGSGGKQYLWWSAGEVTNNAETRLGRGIDIRGTGGYVVVAPSANDLGPYKWDNWGPPHAVLSMPDWYKEICAKGVPASPEAAKQRTAGPLAKADSKNDPNDRLTLAQVQELLKAIPANQRDHWLIFGHVLKTIADWIGGEQKAFEVWDSWASTGDGYGGLKDQQYQWDTFNEPTQHPIGLLIKHARDNGWTPSEDFNKAARQSRAVDARKAMEALPGNATPADLRPLLALIVKLPAMEQDGFLKELKAKTKISIGALRREMPMADDTDDTDAGMIVARQVLTEHYEGGRLLIRSIDKAFWYYNGRFWEPVKNDDEIRGRCLAPTLALGPMKMTVNSVARQALQLLEAMQARPGDPLRLTQPPLPVVNCRNGELWINDDLTVDLRPHRPESYLTHGLDIDYDPAGTCPMFDKALLAIFQDSSNPAEMARHAMELFGYIIQPRRKYKSCLTQKALLDNRRGILDMELRSVGSPEARRSLEQIGKGDLARLAETVPETALEEFYRAFRAWCDTEGIKVPPRRSDVRRDLEHMAYPITDGTKDGCRGQLVVRGLALSI